MCCFLPPFVSPPRRAAPFSFRDRKPARHDDASTFSTSKRTGYNETPSNYHSRVTLVRQNSRSAYFFPLFLSLSFSLLCLIAELLCRVHSFLRARVGYLSIPNPLSFLKENLARSRDDRKKKKEKKIPPLSTFSHACVFPSDERKRSLASFFPPNCFSSPSLLKSTALFFSLSRSKSETRSVKKERDLRTPFSFLPSFAR